MWDEIGLRRARDVQRPPAPDHLRPAHGRRPAGLRRAGRALSPRLGRPPVLRPGAGGVRRAASDPGRAVPGAADATDHPHAGAARSASPVTGTHRSASTARLAWAGGYVGDGVSTTNLAGRTLADLIDGRTPTSPRCPGSGTARRNGSPSRCAGSAPTPASGRCAGPTRPSSAAAGRRASPTSSTGCWADERRGRIRERDGSPAVDPDHPASREKARFERADLDQLLDTVHIGHVGARRRRAAGRDPDGRRPRRRPAAAARFDRLALDAPGRRRRLDRRSPSPASTVWSWPGRRSSRRSTTAARCSSAAAARSPAPTSGTASTCSPTALLPGRVAEIREPTAKELAATLVLALPIERLVAQGVGRLAGRPGRGRRRRAPGPA